MYRFFLIAVIASSLPAHAADELSFNRDIRPILSDTCFFCHGPDAAHREADLRLDIEEQAKDIAIVPGDTDASELVDRITSDDPDLLMPPPESGKKLTAKQIRLIERWIQEGAKYEPYWAYVKPQSHPAPKFDSDWPIDAIDYFTLDKMRRNGLRPSPDADSTTLIRRVSFDLTGLPPSPAEVERFVSDPSPQAYVKLVDRLLGSPEFGERMAIYWLDLVRYADTVGYHGDQDHNASPYRDYVIDALNDNMPFDQFTREQLAGDLLPDPNTDQLIASGYNRLLQTSHEGGVQPKEYLAIYAADRIRNLSAVWMGATVGCAQCHDHKFDPYRIDDFYSMVAFFADIDEAQHFKDGSNALPTKRAPEINVLPRWQRERLQDVETKIDALKKAIAEKATSDASGLRTQLQVLETERDTINASSRKVMISSPIAPREIRVLPRGNWLDDSGPVVKAAIPTFMGRLNVGDRRANRLDLANWLVDAKHGAGGLTARVFVNRLWYLMFGRGISSSLADFGGQGEPPTHGELLDHLAVDFIDSGWNVKRMLRRLALSRTYRQSSIATKEDLIADPYNRWYSRQSRYRLPAEMVRDNALDISGLLVRKVGGSSVKPYQPAGYYRHLNFPQRKYQADTGDRQWRRGVYVHWQRQFLHPMMKSLDAPSREECTAKRPRSNTPLEALVLLNDPSMVQAAAAMASRALSWPVRNTDERLASTFQLATSRLPDREERKALADLLRAEQQHYAANDEHADALVKSVSRTAATDSTDTVKLAAWTSVCRAIMNLYETVTRN